MANVNVASYDSDQCLGNLNMNPSCPNEPCISKGDGQPIFDVSGQCVMGGVGQSVVDGSGQCARGGVEQCLGNGQPQIDGPGQIGLGGLSYGSEHATGLNNEQHGPGSNSNDGNASVPNIKKSYASIFSDNRAPRDDSKLTYIEPPEGNLVLGMEEIDSVEKAFGHCLVGYVMGPRPTPYAMNHFVKRWDNDVKFTYKENGWIRFKFPSVETRDRVFKGGPYMIFGKQLFLKQLPSCFMYSKEDMAYFPSWVQIFGLPSDCWTVKALSKIASVVGKPLHTDMLTITKKGATFARVLVEINAQKERLREHSVVLPTGKIILITFKYEFEPKVCEKCDGLGHTVETCGIEYVRFRRKVPPRQPHNTFVESVVQSEAHGSKIPIDPEAGIVPEVREEISVIIEPKESLYADMLKAHLDSGKQDSDTHSSEQLPMDNISIENPVPQNVVGGQYSGGHVNANEDSTEDSGMHSKQVENFDIDTDDHFDDLSYVISQGWKIVTRKKRYKNKNKNQLQEGGTISSMNEDTRTTFEDMEGTS